MDKAIEKSKSGLTVGHAGLGYRGGIIGSIRQEVHDGDTINIRAIGNFGVRFLGVDAPEISFPLPGSTAFSGIGTLKWEEFLTDPFSEIYDPFEPPIHDHLRQYLLSQLKPGVAYNHHDHAKAAEGALENEIKKDLASLGISVENFRFFLAFANEVMDRYGRMLCFVNAEFPDLTTGQKYPLSYNERLLVEAKVIPYFIWPNINPFRQQKSIVASVIEPGTANQIHEPRLDFVRQSFGEARNQKVGIFAKENPLLILPFELRFLARRCPPDRWVIDLSKSDDLLIHPQAYYDVTNLEDRLFIPEEFIPLFLERGWHKQILP